MLCLQDTAWHLSDMLSCMLSVLLYKPNKACQKLQRSRACLLSRKTHYRLILSPQCPASLNAEHTSSWHVASMTSSFPSANSNHFTMTVDGYSLSLAGINPQIARLPQNWPWSIWPLQLLRLFVCGVLIGDEFCSAGIHAVIWKQFPLWLTPVT